MSSARCRNCVNTGRDMFGNFCVCKYGKRLRAKDERKQKFAQPLAPSPRIEHELPIEHREAARQRLRPPTVIEES
jgi:hypothetical protein